MHKVYSSLFQFTL